MLTNKTKSILLFLFGCIPLRSFLAYYAKHASSDILKIMGYLALIPAISFLIIFITGSRKTGGETFGEPIWWNSLRPIHSLLYFSFAYNAILGEKNSWIYLAIDVIIGFISFILHHLYKLL